MKRSRIYFLILVFFCLFDTSKIHAQFEQAKWEFYGKYSFGFVDKTNYSYVGFNMERQFHPNWTLNWNLELLGRRDDIFQLHGSMGLIGGPAYMGYALNQPTWGNGYIVGNIILGLMIMAAPDGISYHFPIAYRWDLSPYANVLGFDWVQYNEMEGFAHLFYSASAGVRCSYWMTDRFFVKGFIETRKAGPLGWNYGGGIALGWSKPFENRKEEEQ